MMDRISPAQRSRVMAQVRAKDTAPERLVRSVLHHMGYRFRLHVASLPGRPDIVLARHHKVVLVHGCFWHGHRRCKRAGRPQTNSQFWDRKIDGNIQRDRLVRQRLRRLGWGVLVVWQCQTRDREALAARLCRFVSDGKEVGT
jgi:DNA mismatch endonuclease (patch repair protein)